MFTLQVETADKGFLTYLDQESKNIAPFTYLFSSSIKAAETTSRYIIKQLIEQKTHQLVMKEQLKEETKRELYSYISNSTVARVLDGIETKLTAYFGEQNMLHLEGYVSFRLRNEGTMIDEELVKAYDYFLDDGTSNTVYLKKFMKTQQTVEEELTLIVEENGSIRLKGTQKTYVQESIEENNYQGEDAIISHIVMMSPRSLKVYDPTNLLSKETVIILTRLFEKKVKFSREKYVSH